MKRWLAAGFALAVTAALAATFAVTAPRTATITQGSTTVRLDGTRAWVTTPNQNGTVSIAQNGATVGTLPNSANFGVAFKGTWGTCPVTPPAPLTRDAACPSGSGTFPQTQSYTLHDYPTCWQPSGIWLPLVPPPDQCQSTPPPPPGIETTFDHFYAPSFVLNGDDTSNWTYQRPAKPPKATSLATPGYVDAVHGTRTWRISDRIADSSSTGQDHNRHEYSTHGSFNADSSHYLTEDGSGFWFVFDAATLTKIPQAGTAGSLSGFAGDCEAFWHPTNPNKIWRTDNSGSMKWYEYDLTTRQTTVLFDLTSRMPPGMQSTAHLWFKGEGRPSNDGRYFGMQADDANWVGQGAVMYDRVANQIVGWCAGASGCPRPDNVKTSPLGNYFFMAYYDSDHGGRACPRTFQGTDVHQCTRVTFDVIEHGDLALLDATTEVLVQNDYSGGPDGGYIRVSRLSDGAAFHLGNPAADLYPGTNNATVGTHISGVVSEKHPGWVLINFEGSCTDYNRTCPDPTQFAQYDRVGFFELAPAGRVLWTNEQTSSGHTYFSEPQATSNKDGTRVLWASPWNFRDGAATSQAESYMTGLPSWAVPPAQVAGAFSVAKATTTLSTARAAYRQSMKGQRPKYDARPIH